MGMEINTNFLPVCEIIWLQIVFVSFDNVYYLFIHLNKRNYLLKKVEMSRTAD